MSVAQCMKHSRPSGHLCGLVLILLSDFLARNLTNAQSMKCDQLASKRPTQSQDTNPEQGLISLTVSIQPSFPSPGSFGYDLILRRPGSVDEVLRSFLCGGLLPCPREVSFDLIGVNATTGDHFVVEMKAGSLCAGHRSQPLPVADFARPHGTASELAQSNDVDTAQHSIAASVSFLRALDEGQGPSAITHYKLLLDVGESVAEVVAQVAVGESSSHHLAFDVTGVDVAPSASWVVVAANSAFSASSNITILAIDFDGMDFALDVLISASVGTAVVVCAVATLTSSALPASTAPTFVLGVQLVVIGSRLQIAALPGLYRVVGRDLRWILGLCGVTSHAYKNSELPDALTPQLVALSTGPSPAACLWETLATVGLGCTVGLLLRFAMASVGVQMRNERAWWMTCAHTTVVPLVFSSMLVLSQGDGLVVCTIAALVMVCVTFAGVASNRSMKRIDAPGTALLAALGIVSALNTVFLRTYPSTQLATHVAVTAAGLVSSLLLRRNAVTTLLGSGFSFVVLLACVGSLVMDLTDISSSQAFDFAMATCFAAMLVLSVVFVVWRRIHTPASSLVPDSDTPSVKGDMEMAVRSTTLMQPVHHPTPGNRRTNRTSATAMWERSSSSDHLVPSDSEGITAPRLSIDQHLATDGINSSVSSYHASDVSPFSQHLNLEAPVYPISHTHDSGTATNESLSSRPVSSSRPLSVPILSLTPASGVFPLVDVKPGATVVGRRDSFGSLDAAIADFLIEEPRPVAPSDAQFRRHSSGFDSLLEDLGHCEVTNDAMPLDSSFLAEEGPARDTHGDIAALFLNNL